MKPLVIDTPSMQSLRRKYISAVITFIFWMIWIFLWTPLITLVGWLLGIHQVYFQMVELQGSQAVIESFGLFLKCLAAMGGSLAAWALYNYLRFRNIDRRTPLPPVTNAQLSAYFHVDQSVLSRQQASKCLSVCFDEDGKIIRSVELILNENGFI